MSHAYTIEILRQMRASGLATGELAFSFRPIVEDQVANEEYLRSQLAELARRTRLTLKGDPVFKRDGLILAIRQAVER